MATLQDVFDALKHVADCNGRWALDDFADYSGSLGLGPRQLEATLGRIHRRHPELFDPRTGAPVTPAPAAPPDRTSGHTGGPQTGQAAEALTNAEAALSRVHSTVAEFDRHMIEAIRHAHSTTEDGQRRLHELEHDIENTAAAMRLDTPMGARDFQRYLIGRLRDIVAVVHEADDDDTSKQALAAAWAALYASQPARGRSDDPDDTDAPGDPAKPGAPAVIPDSDIDPYVEAPPVDDTAPPDIGAPAPPAPPTAPLPMPGFGAPAAGVAPAPGLLGGLPLSGLSSGTEAGRAPRYAGDALVPDEPASGDDRSRQDPDDGEACSPEPVADETDPCTVTLPNGETVTAATPQLAAVIRSAAEGAPIADAFGRQGITIPAPGTAVADPIDPGRLVPADIGVFTDRHALAVGDGKALLDGQIHDIANVNGPSFLGWQHPPQPATATPPTAAVPAGPEPPTATRPSATVAT
jgi:hypothetical protein